MCHAPAAWSLAYQMKGCWAVPARSGWLRLARQPHARASAADPAGDAEQEQGHQGQAESTFQAGEEATPRC